MKDEACIHFLQWALPRLQLRWQGFRRVRKQVCKRVARRIARLGLLDELAYREYLQSHINEWQILDALCHITISRFYRDKVVFNQLGNEIIPQLCQHLRNQDESNLRCWSAGCARGEEAYSLALLWSFMLQHQYPEMSISITATDMNSDMIHQARKACYAYSSLKHLPPVWRQLAFTKMNDQYCLHRVFQRPVNFSLKDVAFFDNTEPYHLVLCRNLVFTYFSINRQLRFLHRVHELMTEEGVLVLGMHENLPDGVCGWRQWHQLPIYIRQ